MTKAAAQKAELNRLQDEVFRLKEKVRGLEAERTREKQHVDILFQGFKQSLGWSRFYGLSR